MMNNPRSLSVLVEVCMNAPCNESCKSTKCELCRDCMTQNQKIDTIIASQEQKNHGAFKRLFPVSDFNNLGSINFERLSPADKLHSKWFKEMCKVNKDFC